MNRDGLQQILDEAKAIDAAGDNGSRPWYIVLLLGIGGWFAALPLMIPVATALDSLDAGHAFNALVGAVGIAVAVACLRRTALPILLEQTAFPVLLAGAGVMAYSLFSLVRERPTLLAMAATAALVAWLVPKAWLRAFLGAACATFLLPALLPSGAFHQRGVELWLALYAMAGLWLAGRLAARAPDLGRPLDPFLAGWLMFALCALAYWAGPSMLGFVPGTGFRPPSLSTRGLQPLACALSLACTIAAALVLARALPAVRQWWCLGVGLTVAGFTWFLPAIGLVLLLLSLCIADGRYRLAAACGIAAAWIVGSAYYDLSLPLAGKAALFALAGALLCAFAIAALRALARQLPAGPQLPAGLHPGLLRKALAVCGFAALAIANFTMLRNESLIANGQSAYVELAPVDPRSLMQGDYMRLAVKLPAMEQDGQYANTAFAVGRLGPDRVLTLLRFQADDKAPGEGMMLVKLEKKNGRWMLASDAWFFKEGEAQKYEKARYGEFRIAPSGRALLVGMRGPKLEKL